MSFIENIWLEDHGREDQEIAIRVEWHNERNQRVFVKKPHSPEDVIKSLKELVALLEREKEVGRI
jgi:hypothetical protein